MIIGKDAKKLIFSDIIYFITGIFLNSFLVAYLLKITNENLITISLYYIIIHSVSITIRDRIGKIIKENSRYSKKLFVMGIITRGIFILLIVLLAEKIAQSYILIAVFYAISEGLYWCSHELVYINVVSNNNRKKYMTINRVAKMLISIVVPIILGTSIELYSFKKIAIYVLLLSTLQIIISILINGYSSNKNNYNYNYKKFLNYIKTNNLQKVKKYANASLAYGIIESSISTVIVLLTIMTFKTAFNLGALMALFSFFAMISLTIYNSIYNKDTSGIILLTCSIIILFGVIVLLFGINKITLIIYYFCYSITFCIFDAIYNTRKGNLVKECNLDKYKEEYIVYTSIYLSIGRIIGYVFLLIASFMSQIIYMKIILVLISLFAPIYCYLIYKSEL